MLTNHVSRRSSQAQHAKAIIQWRLAAMLHVSGPKACIKRLLCVYHSPACTHGVLAWHHCLAHNTPCKAGALAWNTGAKE